ncbi:MAG: dienelactone hydrolase family protein [Planctomycetales bacterium]|nr:dienelactone hydrolase family protein [Planctomycetales bacterium]
MTRRDFVQLLLAAPLIGNPSSAQSDDLRRDVPWLAEVQTPPANSPKPQPALSPLLRTPDGKPIETVEQWRVERERLRKIWLEFLGPMPAERPPVKLEVLEEDRPDGCVRRLVRYESEVGLPVEGYLLLPTGVTATDRRAGIVALHQTTNDSIRQIAGLAGPPEQQLGLKLARRGFVVFCPRCFLWQNAANYNVAVDTFRRRHPQTLGMRKMLWDAMRGVDVLASLPEVDAMRIGACGHSLGAKESLYLSAFDERVRVAVASEGGTGFTSTNWDAPWYLGPAIRQPNFSLNHHQLLALIAPRPFLILAGESGSGAADGERSWPYVDGALGVYRLFGSPARIGLLNHRQGHSIPEPVWNRWTEWFETYLRG